MHFSACCAQWHSGAGFRELATRIPDPASTRVPPLFSHHESSWITRPLGCHHVFLTTRTHGSLVRSGATVVSAPGERLDYAPARVPPCFSQYENAWIARPLGCHRGFRTLRAAGLRARSGATVFFSLRERMDRSSARVPQWFPHPESGWITRPLGGGGGAERGGEGMMVSKKLNLKS